MASDQLSNPYDAVQSVVTVHFPGGRDLLWISSDSPVARWRVGELVLFRNSKWVVSERTEQSGSLVLKLDAPG